jgi:hypothetical protein
LEDNGRSAFVDRPFYITGLPASFWYDREVLARVDASERVIEADWLDFHPTGDQLGRLRTNAAGAFQFAAN